MVPLTPSAWLGRVLLFSCLTLVVTVGGVVVVGRQWLQEAEQAGRGSQPAGQVLAAEDEVAEGLPDSLIFRIKTEFLDLMQAQQVQVGERLVVDGETVLNGGLTVEGGAAFAGDIAFDAITVSGDISITDGDITAEGSNIDLGDGTITASNIVYEVLAGDGISIDGTQTVTVTNDDRGSAQKIFGKVKVGDVTLTADSNTDTLTLSAGAGVGLSTGSSNTVTISADNLSGWYKPSSTIVSLITSTNNVGIGTSAPTNKLEIDSGSSNVSGLTFTRLDSSSPSGVGSGKVLSLDSGGRVILVTDQTGDTPTAESVLPDAENGGTLYFNGTNWVSSTNLFHNGGSVGISTTSPAGRFHTYTNAVGTIGAIIQGITDQTANLQEWRNGAGSILSYIDADGVFNGSANVAGSIDPGLTQGQIAFQGADGLAGSNSLFWDNSNSRLGIGTSSPTYGFDYYNTTKAGYRLHSDSGNYILSHGNNTTIQAYNSLTLQGPNNGPGYIYLKSGSSSGSYVELDTISADGYVNFKTGGVQTARFVSGNLGIGTSSPTSRLHSYVDVEGVGSRIGIYGRAIKSGASGQGGAGATAISAVAEVTGAGGLGNLIGLESTIGTANGGITGSAYGLKINNITNGSSYGITNTYGIHIGDLSVGTQTNTPYALYASDSNSQSYFAGNVGIGTTSPLAKLHIDMGTWENLFSDGTLDWKHSTGNNYGKAGIVTASNFGLESFVSYPIIFKTNATERMKIDWSGNIGIGTTSPLSKFHINGGTGSLTTGISLGDGDSGIYETVDDQIIIKAHLDTLHIENSLVRAIVSGGFYLKSRGSAGWNTDPTSPVYAFYGDIDTGFYSPSSNNISFSTGGVDRVRIDNAGNVGIGTTVPRGNLDVAGNGILYLGSNNAQHGHIRSQDGIWFGSAYDGTGDGDYYFKTGLNGLTTLMKITAAGNVGIGTTTPLGKLNVEGAATGKALAILNETGDQNILVASASGVTKFRLANNGNIDMGNQLTIGGATSTAGALYFFNNGVRIERTGNSGLSFTTGGSGVGGGSTFYGAASGVPLSVQGATSQSSNLQEWKNSSSTVLAAINASGNLGIGTSTPAYYFQIDKGTGEYNNILADIYGELQARYVRATVNGANRLVGDYLTHMSGSTFGLQNTVNGGSIVFNTNSGGQGIRMTLSSDGNLGIGSTTPTQKLDVVGNARFSAVGSDAYASDLHLTADGTLTTAASDVRLKKDLVELNDDQVLDKLLQLKTYNFAWKSNNSKDIGMVAQEVAQVLPELTFTNPVDGYMGINYSRLPSLLISAMQAQQTQITTLQNTYKLSSTGTLQPTTQATQAAQPTQQPPTDQPWYTQLAEAITVIKETIFSKAVRFEALAQFMANTIFQGSTEFLGTTKFDGKTTITGELAVSNNQAGTITLDAQRRTVSITFSQPFTSIPVVTLTPMEFVTGQYKIAKITESSFEIEVSEPQNAPITFQWHALLKESTDTNTTVQQGELIQAAEHPTPEPSATPNPSPTPATATSSAAVAGATTEASRAAEVETELE